VSRKRKKSATTQASRQETQVIISEQARKETSLSAHKAWFASFTQAVVQIEQDLENDAAWDAVEKVLIEGKKCDFLIKSIVCPNDSNSTAEYEYTPLHYAAARGILSLVRNLVIDKQVSVDIQTQNKKNTPLHLASSRGYLDIVECLIKYGADLNLPDSKGGSALHYAAAGKKGEMNRDVIEYLVAGGADFKKKVPSSGTSMLDVAVMSGNTPVIEYWEDNYKNDLDVTVDVMTQEALALAKYRFKKYSQERGIQKEIIKILKGIMKTRQAKKQGCNAD
jgi:ankyrin repeat protein